MKVNKVSQETENPSTRNDPVPHKRRSLRLTSAPVYGFSVANTTTSQSVDLDNPRTPAERRMRTRRRLNIGAPIYSSTPIVSRPRQKKSLRFEFAEKKLNTVSSTPRKRKRMKVG